MLCTMGWRWKLAALMVLFVLLQTGDLVTTWIGGMQYEANVLAVWAWLNGGWGLLMLAKAFVCIFTYLVVRVIRRAYPKLAMGYLAGLNLLCAFVLVGNLRFLAAL